jgi:threonine aldolase
MARLLADGASAVPGIDIVHPVQANAVFARLPQRRIAALQQNWTFHVWNEEEQVVRWMTSFNTTEADVEAFLGDIRSSVGS